MLTDRCNATLTDGFTYKGNKYLRYEFDCNIAFYISFFRSFLTEATNYDVHITCKPLLHICLHLPRWEFQ